MSRAPCNTDTTCNMIDNSSFLTQLNVQATCESNSETDLLTRVRAAMLVGKSQIKLAT